MRQQTRQRSLETEGRLRHMATPDSGGHIIIQSDDRIPFAKVPAPVMCDVELSLGARMLYGILIWLGWREAWQGEPGYQGQEALGEEFGISARSIRTYMKELEQGGYIEVEQIGLGRPSNIVILPLPDRAEAHLSEQAAE